MVCHSHSYDENGLWLFYSSDSHKTLVVEKINEDSLDVQKRWILQLPKSRGSFNNAFVSCGVLYLVAHSYTSKSDLAYVYDLYMDKVSHQEMIE